MLSPHKQDPKCKEENARKKKNPADFGSYKGNTKPKDFEANIGLQKASTDGTEQVEEQATVTPEERKAVIVDAVGNMDGGNIAQFAPNGLPILDAVISLSGIEDVTEEEAVNTFLEISGLTFEEVTQHAIIVAISNLEKDNAEHFTGDGVPRVEVLEANTGIVNITADERNIAFEMFNDGALDEASGGILGFFKKK